MNQRVVNPDCRDGKHTICDGHGWDVDADTAVRCPCACHPVNIWDADPEPLARMAWEADLP